MRPALLACLALSLALASPAYAQTPPLAPAQETIRDIDTVVVSGVQPGPGMWKVSRGEHVLWILGTLSPVPKNMQWLSRDVEATIAQSQEVLEPPSVSIGTDLGMFRSMLLIPSALKARRNPDDKTLRDVVPADLYARWLPLKARYIGSDRGVEKWRPVFAAQELYEAAMRRSDLSLKGIVWPMVERSAKQHEVKITPSKIEMKIKDPKAVLKDFAHTTLSDTDCFAKTLSRIEGDIETMRARANAWAIGDIEALRALPQGDQYEVCLRAVTASGVAQRLGFGDLRERVIQAWLANADRALLNNRVSFASLPVAELFKPDGYLARLQARGYTVEAP
ncbi:TraB/GumN family protein [Lysobacter sp. Root604]|uniref:TraB/GumN family protein n=1 Tax=Lysobacter sp. Root604 TaxID=1736568 RepID=UPI0006F9DD5C|nr:TraB/GumN family protein [Lysobacter sp. Root604]KRA15390.1 polysaccharide biosynthesis protein GumN [Lysobacter sp. Root604]